MEATPPTGARTDAPRDPGTPPRRPVAAPRLVDFTPGPPQPTPSDQDRPAVFRPYAPQPRIRPEAIVPPEDNPLRGWRGWGAATLSRDLWPRDAATNALMVYYSGRRRGRLGEDFTAMVLWLVVCSLEIAAIGLILGRQAFLAPPLLLASLIAQPTLAGLASALSVSVHARRNLQHLPVDEMLLTRLRPDDIAQGLSVRPLAVHAFMAMVTSILVAGGLLAASYLDGRAVGQMAALVVLTLLLAALRWFLLGLAVETGGAVALRAHMCIRHPGLAWMRTLIDLLPLAIGGAISCAGLGYVAGGLFAYFTGTAAGGAGVMFLGALRLVVILVVGAVVWGVMSMVVVALRLYGAEAMDWCHHYPDEWWFADVEGEDGDDVRRGPFTPWRQMPRKRRPFVRGLREARAERRRRRGSGPRR
jgi:hypothetical protein